MSREDGKLFATAIGAATAGAALAVAAMKMIESNKNDKNGGTSNFTGHESNTNLLAYHPENQSRPIRTSVIMNDPSDLVGDGSTSSMGAMKREPSESMLFPHNHEAKMRRRIATRYTIEEENNLGRDSVTVRVPATSANVGPGCKRKTNSNAVLDCCIKDCVLCTYSFVLLKQSFLSLSFYCTSRNSHWNLFSN
jgi:hypothetical protein